MTSFKETWLVDDGKNHRDDDDNEDDFCQTR
jgi:hypothetical protein